MTSKSSAPSGYHAPAVQKAFQLLQVVAASREEIGLSELAQVLGFSKSTTHGLIQALLKVQALEQGPRHKTFFLGPAIVELAFRSWNSLRVNKQVQPYLDELRDRIDETVFLGVLSHTRGIIMATAETAKPLKISAPPGTSIPSLAGAVGKVYLARLNDEEVLRIVREQGLPEFTARSIVDEKAYVAELEQVRNQGYAIDDEEYLPGVKAVAVSLGNHRGLPLALWVVGFSGSMAAQGMFHVIDCTLETAEKLKSVLDADR